MSEQNEKQKRSDSEGQVEWSFDFANLGKSIKNMANSLAGEEEVHESHFVSSKEGVASATVKVNFAAGTNTIVPLGDESDHLIEANLTHVGEIEFSETGDAEKVITIKQQGKPKDLATPIKQGLRLMANSKDIEWHVGLATGIPFNLKVNGGVGPTKLDLNGLTMHTVKVDAGVGKFTVMLPQQTDPISLKMNSGVGETKVYVPDSISADIHIDAGVGSVNVTIPPNSAVQIRAKNGVGSIHVPNGLRKYDNGLWQSEGFDLAETRIVIHYNGGVGSFHVNEAEIV